MAFTRAARVARSKHSFRLAHLYVPCGANRAINLHMPAEIKLPLLLRLLRGVEFRGKFRLMDAIFGPQLARHGVTWVQTRVGIPWKLDLTNTTHRWIVYGYYEGYAFWRWLLQNRQRIEVVFDSGANIGQTSLYFSTLLPSVRVFAYEPGLAAKTWLQGCVADNRLNNVHVSAAGLGAKNGEAFLQTCGDEKTHGSWNRIDDTEGERIQVRTIDAEMERLGLTRIDLWKLDMEGGEPAAIAGAASALREGRIGAIHAEIMGDSGLEVDKLLRSFGFRPYVARNERLVPAPPTPTRSGDNTLFIHPKARTSPPA